MKANCYSFHKRLSAASRSAPCTRWEGRRGGCDPRGKKDSPEPGRTLLLPGDCVFPHLAPHATSAAARGAVSGLGLHWEPAQSRGGPGGVKSTEVSYRWGGNSAAIDSL